MGRALAPAIVLSLGAAMLGAPAAVSQLATESFDNQQPSWLVAWSPLESRADLPRHLPFVGTTPGSLLLPPTRVGLFWTAGNPAALSSELSDTLTDFSLSLSHEGGSLQRPLDPGAVSLRRASGMGWMPLNERVALIGDVAVEQQTLDAGTRADVIDPYTTSPFVTLDTSISATRLTSAQLEGALGARFGNWAVGLALGYDALERETVNSGLVRRSRRTLPAATIGLTRQFGRLRFGPYARWRNRAETMYLFEIASQGVVVQLEGLRDVQPLDILSYYYRRIDETTPTAGWSIGNGSWVLYIERSWLRERLTRQEADNPASDEWNTDAWSGGGAYQHSFGARTILTVDLRYMKLRGAGSLAFDTSGLIFRAAESAVLGSAEIRVLPDTARWAMVIGLQVRWEHRERDALTVPIASNVTGLTNSVSLELGHTLSSSLYGTATLGTAGYSANSSYPAPTSIGATYDTYLLPEYDLASRPAHPWLGAVGLRWTAGPRTAVWLTATAQTVSPSQPGLTASYGPEGSRSFVDLSFGVRLLPH